MELRPARPGDAEAISALAMRAKAHWGYSDAFMEACRDELSYPPEEVAAGGFQVAVQGDTILGFYALVKISPTAMELDALFVDPPAMGRGCGRALMDHALARCAEDMEITRLVIQADPNAAAFYERAGAVLIGERPSDSIPGRTLPLYEIEVKNHG